MTFLISLLTGFRASRLFGPVIWALVAVAVVVACYLALQAFARVQFQAGVRHTTQEFVQDDLKGAGNVQETADRVIRETHGLDGDADINSVLEANGGLRPDT